eukprot:2560681-Pleurochrysis_carterae.AAC.2
MLLLLQATSSMRVLACGCVRERGRALARAFERVRLNACASAWVCVGGRTCDQSTRARACS